MSARAWCAWLAALVLCCLQAPAGAASIVEAWRSPFGTPHAIAADPRDGSCWAIVGARTVIHLAADGTVLSQRDVHWYPTDVAVNGSDGSCWVAASDLVRLAPDGAVLWRKTIGVKTLAVNSSDGTCWAVGSNRILHIAADGQVLWRHDIDLRWGDAALAVDSTDGSCWIADLDDAVLHIAADGTPLSRTSGFFRPSGLAIDERDGTCWVADTWYDRVVRLDRNGAEIGSAFGIEVASSVSVDPADGSCWVGAGMGDFGSDSVVHLDASGAVLGEFPNFTFRTEVAALAGVCWVADRGGAAVVRMTAGGAETVRAGNLAYPAGVSVNPDDGSCWVADRDNGEVVHLAADGAEISRTGGFSHPQSVSANRNDGSCWVADGGQWDDEWYPAGDGAVAHLSAAGVETWRGTTFTIPGAVSVNSTDGSCWVADGGAREMVHLSAVGAELLRQEDLGSPVAVSVNPTTGSCWVADVVAQTVVHLSSEGQLLSTTTLPSPRSLSVNPTDGSCWVGSRESMAHLSASGEVLWQEGIYRPRVSVDPSDGVCWVADDGGVILRFAADGTLLDSMIWFDEPASISANPSDGSCWVADVRNSQVVRVVVGLSAVRADFSANPRAAAALATIQFTDRSEGSPTSWHWEFGDGATSSVQNPTHAYGAPGRYTVSLTVWRGSEVDTRADPYYMVIGFPDTPTGFWAMDAVVSCYGAGIVTGYPDGGYHPAESVSRAQMAVYIARALAGGDDAVPEPAGTQTFGDVASDHWAYRYVEYCAAEDIVQGYPGGTYHPDEVVNRGQMAVYIARAVAGGDAAVPTAPAEAAFADVPGEENSWEWCWRYVEYCAAREIVQGYADGSYRPANEVTRDQMAVYVARAFGLPM